MAPPGWPPGAAGGSADLSLSFEQAVSFLFPCTGRTPWTLDTTHALLEVLGRPHREFASVHIGGTNGKGSVALLVYEALRAAGYRAALYTSPHLVDVRERMMVDGRPITPEAFAMWTQRIQEAVVALEASFFEATTAIAFADFAARAAEIAVVEVGLGGRLDSTNVVDPLASAVTTVSLEHTEYLGTTLENIAREKAGIAKPGRPFVVGAVDPTVREVLVREARDRGARPVAVPEGACYRGPLGLAGMHQPRNAAVAEALLAALPSAFAVPSAARHQAFQAARLPGRFDRRGRWLFDVAHNAAGVASLTTALADAGVPAPAVGVVGILRDKPWAAMLEQLLTVLDGVWVTQPPTAPAGRRWDLTEVERHFAGRVHSEPDFDAALAGAAAAAGTVVVTGSFHTVGDALARLPGFRPLG